MALSGYIKQTFICFSVMWFFLLCANICSDSTEIFMFIQSVLETNYVLYNVIFIVSYKINKNHSIRSAVVILLSN